MEVKNGPSDMAIPDLGPVRPEKATGHSTTAKQRILFAALTDRDWADTIFMRGHFDSLYPAGLVNDSRRMVYQIATRRIERPTDSGLLHAVCEHLLTPETE